MKKLHKYLSLTTATISAGITNASIIYTDVNPDFTLDNNGDFYDIDMDSSGTTDFTVNFQEQGGWGGQNSAYISGLNGNKVGAYFGYNNYQYYLNIYNSYDLISSQNSWENDGLFGSFYWGGGGGYGGNFNGAWSSTFDKYVALKFSNGVDTFYGWARFDVTNRFNEITIKDFAYEDIPDTPIAAGDKTNINFIANNLIASDIDNKHNGNDLEVSFSRATNENGIGEYRVIAVKESQSSNFNIAKANNSFSYISKTPNGNDHTIIFDANSKDSDGDLIIENEPYNIFILSVPDLITSTNSNLSDPSNTITLQSGVGIEKSLFDEIDFNINDKVVTISSSNSIDKITVINLSGKEVYNESNLTNSTINLQNQLSGIYFISIEINNQLETKKIIL